MKEVILIAFHFPPEGSSSGVLRTLKLTQCLPENGWNPYILTAKQGAYPVSRADQMGDVPPGLEVVRAFALDSARHLAVGGRYFLGTALPDRWITWWPSAVASGMRLIWKHHPSVVWSTFPIATAHLIGLTLRRLSGLPWVADFRDSMTEEGHPPDERQRRVYRWIERRTITRCAKAVFTTPGALRMYAERYPEIPRERFTVVANGYDEEGFTSAEALPPSDLGLRASGTIVLLHSGALYPSERDPRCFYRALAALLRAGELSPSELRVVLRATGHDEHHRRLIQENGLEDMVVLAPALPYREALREMMDVHALLVLQAANCNHQIPAKIYEYFRARRPILALTDPRGDTAATLREMGFDAIVPLDDEARIRQGLLDFLQSIREHRAHVAPNEAIRLHSRRARTVELARILDDVAAAGEKA